MNESQFQVLVEQLSRIAIALEKLAAANTSSTTKMGFTDNPAPVRIFTLRIGKDCWYTLSESGERIPISESAICGIVKNFEIKEVESEDYGERVKADLTLVGDRTYIIRCGKGTNFFKGLVLGLSRIDPSQLQQAITIAVEPGRKETVVLCKMYDANQIVVNTSWEAEQRWDELASNVAMRLNPQAKKSHYVANVSLTDFEMDESNTPPPNKLPDAQVGNTSQYSDRIKAIARQTGHSIPAIRAIASNALGREIKSGVDICSDEECLKVEQALILERQSIDPLQVRLQNFSKVINCSWVELQNLCSNTLKKDLSSLESSELAHFRNLALIHWAQIEYGFSLEVAKGIFNEFWTDARKNQSDSNLFQDWRAFTAKQKSVV